MYQELRTFGPARKHLPFVFSILAGVMPAACKTSSSESLAQGDQFQSTGSNPAERCAAPSNAPFPSGRSPGPTCSEIVAKYPKVADANHPEDKKVMCPFLRILKRTGLLDQEISNNLGSSWAKDSVAPVGVIKISQTVPEIGCQGRACAAVAEQVAMSQNKGWPALTVDIGKLFAAPPRETYTNPKQQRGSHDCGYTFQFGDSAVNPQVRTATLERFNALAAENGGKVKLEHLVQVKKEMCKRDFGLYKISKLIAFSPVDEKNATLLPDIRDHIEVALIWAYLGGMERGWFTVADLYHFFHGTIPPNKTKFFLDLKLLEDSKAAHKNMW